MEFAILAAGEGSRLKAGGINQSKPMVRIGGVPLIERLIRIFVENGAEKIHIIINEHSPDVEVHLAAMRLNIPVQIVKKNTPSSLHSFYNLLPNIESDSVCLTTVDTVFDEQTVKQYIGSFIQRKECDGLMAVTPFIDDESPLYVKVDATNRIISFDDLPNGSPYVSGGIYCLRQNAFAIVKKAVENGTERMRNFQRSLIEEKLNIQAFPFSKIIDIDRIEDLELAEAWLNKD